MRTHLPELQQAGARLVFVGTGLPAMAADFGRTHGGGLPVFSDVKKNAFAAAGMRRGMFSTLHWRLFANFWRAMRAGFRQTRIEGDPWQQGGVLVFAADGRLLHEQHDRVGGDPIDVGAVLAALRG